MAWLFLPENEQVQYLQKIALRAENPSGPILIKVRTNFIFCDSNFLLPIEGSTFSGQVFAIEARDEAIFTRIKECASMPLLGNLAATHDDIQPRNG